MALKKALINYEEKLKALHTNSLNAVLKEGFALTDLTSQGRMRQVKFGDWIFFFKKYIQGDTSPRVLGFVAIDLGSSVAYGPLLQLATAMVGKGNYPNWLQQTLVLEVTYHPVSTFYLSNIVTRASSD